jgi:hypothetical protein
MHPGLRKNQFNYFVQLSENYSKNIYTIEWFPDDYKAFLSPLKAEILVIIKKKRPGDHCTM